MPTSLISPGPVTPILQNVVYALPASPCVITSGVLVQKAPSFAGTYTDWIGSTGGIYHGGSTIQSHVKCLTGNTTIQAVKVKMKGQFAKGSYSELIVKSGPSNYWQLDETSGLVAKDLIGGANGTISGGVTLGVVGALSDSSKAMTFNGTTGQIVTTTTVNTPTDITIECWAKTTALAQCPFLSTRNDPSTGSSIYAGVANGAAFQFCDPPGGGAVNGIRLINDGLWHHLAYVTRNAIITVDLYVDGVLDKSGLIAPRTLPSSGVVGIGYDDDTSQYWQGSLDDVAIYPRALSPTEILSHYNAAK